MGRSTPPPRQVNHANSAYFRAISPNYTPISTLGPLFLQILDPALEYEYNLWLIMNVAPDYDAPIQICITEIKSLAGRVCTYTHSAA